MPTLDAVRRWADRRGYRVAFAPAAVLVDVDERLRRLRAAGAFAPGFAEAYLAGFAGPAAGQGRESGSVVVVAVPRPAWVVRFEIEEGAVEAVVPPTYVEYRQLFEQVRAEICEALGGTSHVETLKVPLKSLAAAVGLVSYGRNNVAYVSPYGSYVQLVAYLVDLPTDEPAPELEFERLLDRCASCRACVKACPTGAIDGNRFLLHADRCYTLASEVPEPLPEEARPPSPECLIGCLKCQEVCPANRGLLERRAAAASFTREETDALIGDDEIGQAGMLDAACEKFASLAMTDDVSVLRRNLRQVVELARARYPGAATPACLART
jgi:epoxyqueuosine reductase